MKFHGRILLIASLLCFGHSAVHADDWGLTRERPRRTKTPSAAAGPRAGKKPKSPNGARAQTDRTSILQSRYLRMLLRDPLEAFALERLLTLHRERDGNVDGLARELAERTPESPALWLLRGQVELARADNAGARAAFARAAELDPDAPGPLLLSARLAESEGALGEAEVLFTRALERTSAAQARAEIVAKLGALALAREDFTLAEQRYGELAAGSARAGFGATEFARALAEHGHHGRAADAYAAVAKRLRGDNRVLAPLLLEQARAELDAERIDASLATLARARKLAGAAAGIRHAIDELRVEVHRRAGTLAQLAQGLGREGGATFERLELLARVLEELGEQDRAAAVLRRALALQPRHGDARLRLIRILTGRGEIGEAIAQYRKLIAAAPRDTRHLLELAQLLMESGERKQALALVAQASRRGARDAGLHRALHAVYLRWGELELARKVLERLARIEPSDPAHLVALGEQQLEAGERDAALATWRRILRATPERARAHATLAGTYMDHDMPEKALAEWETAARLDPKELRYVRGLAEVLERLHKPADAIRQWERVLELAPDDRVARREARRRLVRLWAATGQLQGEVRKLEQAFYWRGLAGARAAPDAGTTPDVEAGRMLAEAYAVMGRGRGRRRGDARYLVASERVLDRVIELEPGDIDSMLALERARTSRGDADGAIAVLRRLVEADPKNARSYLARMAENALTLYRDEDAMLFAERSVALNPADALAQRRLGDLYRARQHEDRAMASYRRAIELDERAYPVYVELAELYLSRGEHQEADALLRRVVRASPDDDLVRRAQRALVQMHMGLRTLESLEQTLLPLALSHSRRPVYRVLLLEYYETLTRGLVEATRGQGAAARDAAEELQALGRRAIKPLLEALADEDPNQRRIAVELLGRVGSEHAVLPLLRLAESDASTALRLDALLAAGRSAPDAYADRFAALTRVRERRLQEAAAWSLCRMHGPRAVPHLRTLARSSATALRGYGLLGLGLAADRTSLQELREAARADRHAWVRGMALLALGVQRDRGATPLLMAAASAEQDQVADAAVIALGALGDVRAAEALADLLFQPDAERAGHALWALGWLATAEPVPVPDALPLPVERLRIAPFNRGWLSQPAPAGAAEVLARFAPELSEAARGALLGTADSVLSVLSVLAGQRWVAGPTADGPEIAQLRATLRPELEALLDHPAADIRAATVRVLGGAPDREAVVRALEDPDERVRGAALDSLRAVSAGRPVLESTIGAIALGDERWWMRQRAVQALGRLGAPGTVVTLGQVIKGDPFAYVREAAVQALVDVARSRHCAGGQACALEPARAALRASLEDPEPRVRVAASAALRSLSVPMSRD